MPSRVLTLIFDECVLLQSEATFQELQEVLIRPKFNRYLQLHDRLDAITLVHRYSTFVQVQSNVFDCRDAKDNKFLALAVDGAAQCLITGDTDLLSLDPIGTCRILKANDFLKLSQDHLR